MSVDLPLVRQLWESARAIPFVIPQMLIERLARVVVSDHRPVDGYCLRCRTDAPCQRLIEAIEQVHAARLAVDDYFAARF